MLVVQLFGPPQVYRDGQPLKLARRKSRALLYYVAAHAQPVTRGHLLAMFWPDTPHRAGHQVLRTTLHGLRRSLGTELVVSDEHVALAPTVPVDARALETVLSEAAPDPAALTRALDLYRGDFLAEITLDDAPDFENWITGERERYLRLAVRGLIALSRLHEEGGDYATALATLDRALSLDPLQEDLQRAAMRLHYLAGDRPGAIRRFVQLRALLDDEMGVLPMPETQALYDAIVTDRLKPEQDGAAAARRVRLAAAMPAAGRRAGLPPVLPTTDGGRRSGRLLASPPPSGAGPLPFVGRTIEMGALATLLSGRQLALIEGETGIGKSRLAGEFLRAAGVFVLAGAGHELEQNLPYQPLIEALRGLLARPDWPRLSAGLAASLSPVWLVEMARLAPELGALVPGFGLGAARPAGAIPLVGTAQVLSWSQPPGAPAGSLGAADESRLWEGVHQFLLALSALVRAPAGAARSLVLFLDDLHWADTSTLALLGYLLRQPGNGAVGFLAATRPVAAGTPLAALLQTLARAGALLRLPLNPLTQDDVLAIARGLSRDFAYPLSGWLLSNSEGNPYILVELVRHAREERLLSADGQLDVRVLSASPPVPSSIYSLIQSRLARLSAGARRVLDAAVAVGREFEVDVVGRAAGLSEGATLDALDELQSSRLIRPLEGLRYTFDHALTMEVALREVGEPRHRLLHRRVAEAIESVHRNRLDALAGVLAMHFSEGQAPERAAPYAFRAGQEAARLAAWPEAIAFFAQALEGAGEGERLDILMALGQAQLQAGEAASASETLAAAAALAASRRDPKALDDARLALAQSYMPQACYAEAIALAGAVLASGLPENAVRAEYAWGAALSLEGADLAGAAGHLAAAAALCSPERDPGMLARIRFEQGGLAAQQGDLEKAVALYREALVAASEADDAVIYRVLANNNLAYHLLLLGDPSASEYARAGMALAQEQGVLAFQPYLYSTLGEIALAAGDVDAAERSFNDGLALAERLSMPERVAGLTANLGLVAIRRGQQDLAIHRLSSAAARADETGTQHLAAQIRIWLAPLLPSEIARACLAEARAIAESGGRRRLLEEVARIEATLPPL